MLADIASRQPETPIAILKAIFSYDAAPAMKETKVPIIAINSDLNPTNLDVNHKYAPQFEVLVIEGTGHYPMLEDPARFNALLSDALRKLK